MLWGWWGSLTVWTVGCACNRPSAIQVGTQLAEAGPESDRGGLLVLVLHQVVRWRAVLGCPFVSVVDEEEEEDCFYIAPFFALEQTHCAHI